MCIKIEDKRNLDKALEEGRLGVAQVILTRISDELVDEVFDECNKKLKTSPVKLDKRKRRGFFPSPKGGKNSHKDCSYRTTS